MLKEGSPTACTLADPVTNAEERASKEFQNLLGLGALKKLLFAAKWSWRESLQSGQQALGVHQALSAT